ncbi:response regulator [Desulfofustis limnaeus]|jgi:CheY-like chemotaxis protein|uniref:Transcriptional regulator n=1 Tax=Desulfofustis limnaeus TaxID=2740163 RepID=A0ABN6M5B1_9BACT|nr:response regulator [Desulfofustis limnaeus]MDX9894472.1 response regulator [Desulfofustis sp.]BDD87105.1 transcriptional regulator [Desulfofustis limnaeus]
MKVLVIDDEPAIRDILRTWLGKAGITVFEAANGLEGMQVQENTPVDLLICDLIMPVQEGIETITSFRQRYPVVGIIAISGGGRLLPDSYLELAQQLGAWKVFRKPLDLSAIVQAVQEWCGQKGATSDR